MTLRGAWYVTHTALDQYLELTGRSQSATEDVRAEAERELRAMTAEAHYVSEARTPLTEIWRGPRPKRLRFLVRIPARREGEAPQLIRVEGAHAGQRSGQRERKQATFWDGERVHTIEFTEQVNEAGGTRRFAYLLTDGTWLTGFRGRARPDHVERYRIQTRVPSWVRELRGHRSTRGRDRKAGA